MVYTGEEEKSRVQGLRAKFSDWPWEIFVPQGLLDPVSGFRSVEAG